VSREAAYHACAPIEEECTMISQLRFVRWNRKYALRSYITGAMWPVPLLAILVYQVFHTAIYALNGWLVRIGLLDEQTAFFALSSAGARSLLETAISANLSFLVFTFGSLLVAIQVAGGQYTPRIIATILLRDNMIRFTVGWFVFALGFALRVLTRMDEKVPQLDTFVAAILSMVSIMVFLFLIDYAARLLRPVSLAARVGQMGIDVIEDVYPQATTRPHPATPSRELGSPARTVTHAGAAGVVLAANMAGLVTQARRANGVIEFVPLVGDFVAFEDPLFNLYGGASTLDDQRLRGAVALGSERTMEQDPTFAFRILVDIAIKALSAAINDPTTAVLAIDQLHRLLRLVGLRNLGSDELRDDAGQLRLVFRTPNWEDYVHLSCTEIRHCGAGSIQIMRRLRAMLDNLVQTLPPHRHAELRLQLDLLDRTVEGSYQFAEDRALARIGDSQGLGGALGVQPLDEAPMGEADG
jgi:uncharacterized membrane protein